MKQLFATMHDALDQIMEKYPYASYDQKQQLDEKLDVLKKMSDSFIEQWLLFEEKLGQLHPHMETPTLYPESGSSGLTVDEPGDDWIESFERGQGYFKLLMFEQAAKEFQTVIRQSPDLLSARLFLALALMKCGEYADASRHLHFIIPFADDARLKAVALNAIGCIHVVERNYEQACTCFRESIEADPSFMDPVRNMEVCKTSGGGELQFGIGMGLTH